MDIEKLKFPIGKFQFENDFDEHKIENWINTISEFPEKVKKTTYNLSTEQLNWKYRPNGWMIKQVVHHCADSHMNSFIRFKLALTENFPTIRPYYEDRWAELVDSLDNDLSDSITLLKGLHSKWVKLLSSLNNEDLIKEFVHPEHGTKISLAENIAFYAWHCEHHLAHIHQAIKSEGKYNS